MKAPCLPPSAQGVRLAQLVPTLTTEGPRAALAKALDQELARLQRLAKHAPCGEASQEPRLHHPGLFLLLNGIPVQPHLRRVLLEQFAHPDLEGDPTGRLLRQVGAPRGVWGFGTTQPALSFVVTWQTMRATVPLGGRRVTILCLATVDFHSFKL